MKKYIALLLALCLSLLCLSACGGDEEEVKPEVKYSVYEKEQTDYISLYLTARESDGEFSITPESPSTLTLLERLESSGNGAEYTTLIYKATAEGEDAFAFSLESGKIFEYSIKVKKDEQGILRITVKAIG
ncbi:MAG: hypothetical protein IJY88_03915 [Clostridia bacterium]|nr:hypothetical protein [Clostridia bacterium]